MKKKDLEELKNKSIDQLRTQIQNQQKEIANIKMEQGQTKTKNVHLQNVKRRNLARIKTLFNIKLLAERDIKNGSN